MPLPARLLARIRAVPRPLAPTAPPQRRAALPLRLRAQPVVANGSKAFRLVAERGKLVKGRAAKFGSVADKAIAAAVGGFCEVGSTGGEEGRARCGDVGGGRVEEGTEGGDVAADRSGGELAKGCFKLQ